MSNVYVLGGVSAVGKTTIGKLLSAQLRVPFYDGDDYHPKNNVDKMAEGIALNDEDRKPWLLTLSKKLQEWNQAGGGILACSALKENYRTLLATHIQPYWIFLEGDYELLKARILARKNHFFKEELLQSQFNTYERPNYGIKVSVDQKPEAITQEILSKLDTYTHPEQY